MRGKPTFRTQNYTDSANTENYNLRKTEFKVKSQRQAANIVLLNHIHCKKKFEFKSKNRLTLRCNKNQTIREGQTYALIYKVAKFKPKSSVRRNKFKTFFSVYLFIFNIELSKICPKYSAFYILKSFINFAELCSVNACIPNS